MSKSKSVKKNCLLYMTGKMVDSEDSENIRKIKLKSKGLQTVQLIDSFEFINFGYPDKNKKTKEIYEISFNDLAKLIKQNGNKIK